MQRSHYCSHSLLLTMCFLLRFFCSVAVSAFVEAFDVIVNGPLALYLSLSQKIGGDVQKHVSHSLMVPD